MSQQNSKRHCPRCGLDNDPDALFCGGCQYQFTRQGTDSNTDIRRTTMTPVDNLIGTTISTLYPGLATPHKRNIIRVLFFSVLFILIVGALFLGMNLGKGSTPTSNNGKNPATGVVSTSGNTPIQGNTTSTTGITPTPIDTPTSVPTPLPFTVSKTGDVCQPPFSQFQASGWVSEKNSFVFTGTGSNVVISPCTITTPNYSVTATIMLFKGQLGVGVIAHADSGGQTGYAGGSGCRNISFGRCGFFINDHFGDIMGIDQEANLTGQTHTYKLTVDGVTLQLFYDNRTIPIDKQLFATYPQAGYAGVECYDQCEVTGYTVTGI